MFDINNIRDLLAHDYKVEVINDYVNINDDDCEKLYNALDKDDTSEIVVYREGKYQGGAVITKYFGQIDLMCVHEVSTSEVRDILEYDSNLKPLTWTTNTNGVITACSIRYVYSINTHYHIMIHDMITDVRSSITHGLFNDLNQAILWVERNHHLANMRGYVYGV